MAKKELGQMLLEEGLITQEELKEAVYRQVIYGGRLGTALLEMGCIDEDTLAQFLARQYRTKEVSLEALSGIQPSIIQMVPRRLAEKYEVVPFKLEGNRLYVVTTNPNHIGAISELSFVTAKVIIMQVLPEARVYELLNRYYGIGRELRYFNIALMEEQRRKPEKETKGKAPEFVDERFVPQAYVPEAEQNQEIPLGVEPEELNSHSSAQTQGLREEIKEEIKVEPLELTSETAEKSSEYLNVSQTTFLLTEEVLEEKSEKLPDHSEADSLSPREASGEKKFQIVDLPPPPESDYDKEKLYLEIVNAIFLSLFEAEVTEQIPETLLQAFLRSFVKNELKGRILPLETLSNFLLNESDLKPDQIKALMEKIFQKGLALQVYFLVPVL